MKFNKEVKSTLNYMEGESKQGFLDVEEVNKSDTLFINNRYFYIENLNRANLVLREFQPSNTQIPKIVAFFKEA